MDQEKIWDHFQNEGVQVFAQSLGRQEYLVRRLAAGSRVLNIGVGDGSLEILAIGRKIDIWSLDPSERAIAKLRSKIPQPESAQVGHAQKMPFPDAHFDCVVMSEVLEHLDDEVLAGTLAEVHRVMRAGGRFIGTVPAREHLESNNVVCPCCGVQFHRWGHKRSFSIDTLTDTLSPHFRPVSMYEHFFIDWESANWWRKVQGLVKQLLSWRGIGTYGTSRSIYFCTSKEPNLAPPHG